MTLVDKSHLPKSSPSGSKILDPSTIPLSVSYKWTNANKLVWLGQFNSGWAAQNLESDYCSLGDKFTDGTEGPSDFHLLLKNESPEKNYLIRPRDFRIPTGRSYPAPGIHIWDMILPENSEDFHCLGHAISGKGVSG